MLEQGMKTECYTRRVPPRVHPVQFLASEKSWLLGTRVVSKSQNFREMCFSTADAAWVHKKGKRRRALPLCAHPTNVGSHESRGPGEKKEGISPKRRH